MGRQIVIVFHKRGISHEAAIGLQSVYGVNFGWLFTGAGPMFLPVDEAARGIPQEDVAKLEGDEGDRLLPEESVLVPMYEAVPAGSPSVADSRAVGHFPILAHQAAPNRYVLRVIGDSMNDMLQSGDLVLVEYRENPTADSLKGRVVVCRLHDEITIKRLAIQREGGRHRYILSPDNPDPKYEAIDITNHDDVKIVGVVLFVVQRQL